MKPAHEKLLNIKGWSRDDRPREKLLEKGAPILSNAELIAILLRSGTSNVNAVEVAKRVLLHCGNNLAELGRMSVRELTKLNGIGEVKAITIVAAMELARRRKETDGDEKPRINSSQDAFRQVSGDLMDLPHEEFWVLLLNRANRVVKKKRVSEGGVSGTVADPKIIFKMALEELASAMIVAHNHPSSNLTASQHDIDLTRKLKEAGTFLEIQLLDHLIICGGKYLSFADEGLL